MPNFVLLQEGKDNVKPFSDDKLCPLLLDTDGAVLRLDLEIPGVVHVLHHIQVLYTASTSGCDKMLVTGHLQPSYKSSCKLIPRAGVNLWKYC